MDVPTDRTLTLYQSRQRGKLWWYVSWTDDQGKTRKEYIGATLPESIDKYFREYKVAQQLLQTAIKREMTRRQQPDKCTRKDVHYGRQES